MSNAVENLMDAQKRAMSIRPKVGGFPYLAEVALALTGSNIALGAQDCSAHEQGAYTGEVSTAMLAVISPASRGLPSRVTASLPFFNERASSPLAPLARFHFQLPGLPFTPASTAESPSPR